MAFNPGGTDYTGFLEQRRKSDVGLTSALKAKGEAEKAKRIADSKKRSGGQKLLSAVARGAAAYYTGGLSETMGGGDMIDKAMLGADAETNEYGQLVGMASQVGGAMSAKKGMEMTTKLAAQDKADAAMQTRLDNLDPTGQMGMEFAMNREKKQKQNLSAMEAGKKGSFGGLFQGDIEGVNLEPTEVGDWQSKIPQKPDVSQYKYDPKSFGDEGRRQQGQLGTPSSSDSGQVPTGLVPPSSRAPQITSGPELGAGKPKSAAIQYESQGSPTLMQQASEEKERLLALPDGGMPAGEIGDKGKSNKELGQERAIQSWMGSESTLTPNEQGKRVKIADKWGDRWNQRKAAQYEGYR